MNDNANEVQKVRFLFDPACPWAYRASLWIREAAKVRPIKIHWEVFSLEYVNRDKKEEAYLVHLRRNRRTLRLLESAWRVAGNEGIDALYSRVGKARHKRRRALNDEKMLEEALEEAGLPPSLLEETRTDPELDSDLEQNYAQAEKQGAFGVPTLFLDGNDKPFYGPLLKSVPSGEEAGEVWDHVSGLIQLPYFYELKRNT